jgi:hypothetical protein
MNWHRFERAKSIALFADRVGNRALARLAASEAISLAETRRAPEFSRHPTVGLIETDDATLAALRNLAASA